MNRKWKLLRRSGKKSCRNQVDAYWAIYYYMLPRSFHCPSQHSSITRIWEETIFFFPPCTRFSFFFDILSLKAVQGYQASEQGETLKVDNLPVGVWTSEFPTWNASTLSTNFRRAHGYLSFLKLSNLFMKKTYLKIYVKRMEEAYQLFYRPPPPLGIVVEMRCVD